VVNVHDALDLGHECQILEHRKVHPNAVFLVGSTMRVFGSEMVKLTRMEIGSLASQTPSSCCVPGAADQPSRDLGVPTTTAYR
jgi:hypothetical protein